MVWHGWAYHSPDFTAMKHYLAWYAEVQPLQQGKRHAGTVLVRRYYTQVRPLQPSGSGEERRGKEGSEFQGGRLGRYWSPVTSPSAPRLCSAGGS